MLAKIETLNYRALRYVSQSLRPFQVLIGPNASGKSTFLDVVALVADILVQPSVTDAVRGRAPDFRDMTWMREGDWIEFAVEAFIPAALESVYERVRYELRLGVNPKEGDVILATENLWMLKAVDIPDSTPHMRMFPQLQNIPDRITAEQNKRTPSGWRKIVGKTQSGSDYFKSEKTDWNNQFRLSPKRSALANLPEDEERFPVATWFKRYMAEGVQRIMLNSEALRRPSPPQSPRSFLPDGSNLPWVIHELEQHDPQALLDWIGHIRTALPDVQSIKTIERPEDRHRYLVIDYASGLAAPSWAISDGTLRMLALTLIAYIKDFNGILLIEEPENGIHPRAVETVVQALNSVYDAQIFLATHSPVILSQTIPSELLCFARTDAGETDIVRGDHHPKLRQWQGETTLSTLYAAGVLG